MCYNVYVLEYNKGIKNLSRGKINALKRIALRKHVSVGVSKIKDLNKQLYMNIRAVDDADNFVWSGVDKTSKEKVTFIVDKVKQKRENKFFLLKDNDTDLVFSVYNHETGKLMSKTVRTLSDLLLVVHYKQRRVLMELIGRLLDQRIELPDRRFIPRCEVSYNSGCYTYNLATKCENGIKGYRIDEIEEHSDYEMVEKGGFKFFDENTTVEDIKEKVTELDERLTNVEALLDDTAVIERLSTNKLFRHKIQQIISEYASLHRVSGQIESDD